MVGDGAAGGVHEFRQVLASWFRENKRALPWRDSRDPYRVWVSEVMLQQTRADQATPYYERFLETFETVEDLAAAPLDEVLIAWEGLGYYSRARNLHRAATTVVRDHGGQFPGSYEGLKALPGVGDYTASAIGSIAFDVPEAVLDGNVIRVLTRLDANGGDVRSSGVRRQLRSRAQALLDTEAPGHHNEAIMELGATICTPRNPQCEVCPVSTCCAALAAGSQDAYPFKSRKPLVPHHTVVVGVVADDDGRLLIQRRPEDAMLGGLWEFPGGKREPDESLEAACARELHEELGIEVAVGPEFARIKHAYSHFKITLHAFPCRIVSGTPESRIAQPLRWVIPTELDQFAFPRANRRLIELLNG